MELTFSSPYQHIDESTIPVNGEKHKTRKSYIWDTEDGMGRFGLMVGDVAVYLVSDFDAGCIILTGHKAALIDKGDEHSLISFVFFDFLVYTIYKRL